MTFLVVSRGAYAVQEHGQWLLLASGVLAALLGVAFCRVGVAQLGQGVKKAARQVLPAIPILFLIGTVSATWMLGGVVPLLIDIGLKALNPSVFLLVCCCVCALISVLSGSSWTTIATIGVAFMGIGTVMGYGPGWIAGAIISGAYFGDKISPLSDTTVLASSSCGVNLFAHIRNMMVTTLPSFVIAIIVFGIVGLTAAPSEPSGHEGLMEGLRATFNLSPWILSVPTLTALLIAFRVNSYLTLTLSTLAGLVSLFVFQSSVVQSLAGADGGDVARLVVAGLSVLVTSTRLSTGSELLDSLVETGGMEGMLPTVMLVGCATLFGGMMIGAGMLRTITEALRSRLRSPRSAVTTTVAGGLGLNACTGDQFLSIVISANIHRDMYARNRLDPLLLSRTVEDSVSVTSVLIPWNSCGLTQSAVLGVATLTYLPFCFFNLLSPVFSLLAAWFAGRAAPALSAVRR